MCSRGMCGGIHTGVLTVRASVDGPVHQWYCGHLSKNAVFPCNAVEHFQQTHQALYCRPSCHVYMHVYLLEMCVYVLAGQNCSCSLLLSGVHGLVLLV